MKLLELFERNADWHWLSPAEDPFDGMMERVAGFEVDGVQYIAGFGQYPMEPGAYMFGFVANVDGEWKENEIGTGASNAMLVFTTVMDIIGAFLQESSPPVLFVGSVPNRAPIYKRLLKRRETELNSIGYTLGEPQETTVPVYGHVVIFPLRKEGLT
jgi:hypothetical protein